MSHVINDWHAYKIDASTAELTVLGDGFGTDPGAVKIIVKGGGNSYPQIKKWCDDAIVTECPVDSEVMVVFVDLPDSKGKKDRKRTEPSTTRASTGVTPDFFIASVTPSPDNLTLTGDDLEFIDQIILYDLDNPPLILGADFVEDLGQILVEWPANFSGEIEKLRAVQNPDKVQEVLAPVGGWSPSEPGLVQYVVGSRDVSGDILITINGIDFGTAVGDVFLTTGGNESQALVVSWTDSQIVVTAQAKTVYDAVRVVDGNGVEADVAPSAPLPVKTPGVEASIATVTQVGENPEVFRIAGTNLDNAASGEIVLDGTIIEYFSDDPAFYDTAAAANNAANGVASVSIAPGQVDITAANDLSGRIAQQAVLKDLNGALNSNKDFPDFLVSGLPGNPSTVVTLIETGNVSGQNGAYGFLDVRGTGMLAAKHLVVNDESLNDVILLPEPGLSSGATRVFIASAHQKYTNPRLILQDDSEADISWAFPQWGLPETYFMVPGNIPTAGLGATNPAANQVLASATGIEDVTFVSVTLRDPSSGAAASKVFAWDPDNVRFFTWYGSYATAQDRIDAYNGNGERTAVKQDANNILCTFVGGTWTDIGGNPYPVAGAELLLVRAFADGTVGNGELYRSTAIGGPDAPITMT